MNCDYFGKCGSCNFYQGGYETQIRLKENRVKADFHDIFNGDFEVFKSPEENYRYRVEFKVWHKGESIHYAMRGVEKNDIVLIDNCSMVSKPIENLMSPLLSEIGKSALLSKKLFSIEFLSNRVGDIVVTLIYHKKLSNVSDDWDIEAKEIQTQFNISIIGRSRKEKRVLGKDYISDKLEIEGKEYQFRHLENSFSQPNPAVNQNMVNWIVGNVDKLEKVDDLIELYCGSGNFTIPLSTKFNKVLATESSKLGIISAIENRDRNSVKNIDFIRVSSEEFTEAIDKKRVFFRLKDIDLDSFSLNTIFVDPPRSGLDNKTIELTKRFKNILYISCNPETFKRDLDILGKTHKIRKMAIFDQFPYTKHLEMGAILESEID